MSVVAFVVIYFAEQIISTILMILIPNNFYVEFNSKLGATQENIAAFSSMTDYMLIGVIITILLSAAMYIVSNVILSKRLNLE
jgi:hypothetical protein